MSDVQIGLVAGLTFITTKYTLMQVVLTKRFSQRAR